MSRKSWLVQFSASFAMAGVIASAPASAVSLVANGGFETGSFSSWTPTGDASFSSVSSDTPVPQTGTYGASFGPFGTTGGISQTLATLAGTSYILDFWLQDEADVLGAFAPNSFLATWNGATVTSLLNSPAFNYRHFTLSVTATSPSTVLGFTFRNDPGFWDLDNVSVAAVIPEPETWALMGVGLALLSLRRRSGAAPH